MANLFQNIVYQEPSSIYLTATSVMSIFFLGFLVLSELMGKHLEYSKFWNVNNSSPSGKRVKLSSRTGMLILYTPAALMGLASFVIFPDGGNRFLMLKSAISIHFCKRVLETFFVHKYSGGTGLDSVIVISAGYFFSAATMIYIQSLTQGVAEPIIDLKYPGLVIFLVGISGNFYHHYLLSKLRKGNEKGYKIPTGGLFGLVICPHYLFEILGFIGISFIAQTPFSYTSTIGIASYLMSRSYATRKWYLSKFENFPKNVKALIPFVF